MNDFSTVTDSLDQSDEEILTYMVTDEALEAAASTERGDFLNLFPSFPETDVVFSCCVA
jgi:hypothetical protein